MEKSRPVERENKSLNGIWILIVELNRSMRYTEPGMRPSCVTVK